MKQTDYIIVLDNNMEKFLIEIEELMKEGWVCQGGISVEGGWLHQAMVKNEPEPL